MVICGDMDILILHSSGTKSAARRILELLTPAHNVVLHGKRPEGKKFDLVILHNRRDLLPDEPSLIYCCGSSTQKILEYRREVDSIVQNKPVAIWTNSWSAAYALRERLPFIPADKIRCMYRPKRLHIPDVVPPIPDVKRIMWFWDADDSYYCPKDMLKKNIEAMRRLKGIEIWLIAANSKKGIFSGSEWAGIENIKEKGRIDFFSELSKVHGLVRLTKGLDFGRSTFDILAYGRWVLYLNMKEQYVENVDFMKEVPGKIEKLLDEAEFARFNERHEYALANFNEKTLKKVWAEEVQKLFE